MPRIRYLPDEKTVETAVGETILRVSLRAGIAHAHACGGNAKCSTCRVLILKGVKHCSPRNGMERALAESLHFGRELRLACQTTISGNVTLRRLVLDEEDLAVIGDLKTGPNYGLVGEERRVAIMFADIRAFTPFAEALPAYDIIYVLNRYFHQMSAVIERHGGHVDNIMGDGLMALFGMDDPRGAAMRAVKAGLGMLAAVRNLQTYLESIYSRSFRIGIGIHFGTVVVGTLGFAQSKRVTAIGDAVNLASRIEAANKQLGTEFLISRETYARVRSEITAHKKCVRVLLPGKSGEFTLHEVTGLRAPRP